jgi:hypothetical protein
LNFTGKKVLFPLLGIDARPITPVILTCDRNNERLLLITDCLAVDSDSTAGMGVESRDFLVDWGPLIFIGGFIMAEVMRSTWERAGLVC